MPKQTANLNRPADKRGRVEPGRSSRKARRAAAERRRRRTRTATIGVVAAVVAIVAVMVAVALTRSTGTSREGTGDGAGRAAELAQSVPASVLEAVGAQQGLTLPTALPSGTPPLEQKGKTEIVYIGAEYCPYCAAERWPVVVALSRFGGFKNLGGAESGAEDIFPGTPTFTFHGATYTSDVLALSAVETNTSQRDPSGGYTALDTPTAEQEAVLRRYDRAPYTDQAGAIPFLLIGNKYVVIGSSYDPTVLQGLTRDQIAEALSDPSSPVARAVDGAANTLTAAICKATQGEPSSVCSAPTITKIGATLPTNP